MVRLRGRQEMAMDVVLAGWICCLLGWLAPAWALSNQDNSLSEDQENYQVHGQILLWLLSLACFYSLVWLLGGFSMEQCPVAQRDTEVTDCRMPPPHTPCGPRRGCSVRSGLKSLGYMEQELVSLMYRLRKLKMALATGWLTANRQRRSTQADLPDDFVIYAVQDET
ncbi:uncharacterized protein LOC144325759 isoform X2 [Podarcis muralis]